MLAPPPLPRTVEASFRDLDATRPAARASSIEDLVRHVLADPSLRPRAVPLIARALHDDVAGVRSAAAVGLADLHASEALAELLVAIEDGDGHVRQMALAALGEIGDGRAAPRLRRALFDPRPEVRYQAVIAFARVVADDATEAVGALRKALDDDDSVRHIALRVLEERVDAGVRDEVDGVVPKVKGLMAGKPSHVALAAAILLAKLGDAAARGVILDVVEGRVAVAKGLAQEDEREAVELAGALGLQEAIPALERRAFGLKRRLVDTCAYSATIALARLGHPRARADLMRGLRSARRATREAAVVAVGRARMKEALPLMEAFTASDVEPSLLRRALQDLHIE
jgi:HEAT repeat protein